MAFERAAGSRSMLDPRPGPAAARHRVAYGIAVAVSGVLTLLVVLAGLPQLLSPAAEDRRHDGIAGQR